MKKDKIDFLIMYEVTTRELESIILLGNELKQRGYSVEYFSFEHSNLKKYLQNKKHIKKYYDNVEIVLMPSLYHDKEVYHLVHYVCGNCKNIVNLRWEQAFTYKNEKDFNGYQYPHGDARMGYHLCWGNASRENMISAGINDSKLLLCGPIHMDFLREQFCDYYVDKKQLFMQYNLPIDKKSVLYISSFALASMTERQLQREEENAGRTLFDREQIKHQKESRRITLEWIEELLKEDSCTFIYRPHPVENVLEDLAELEDKYENFHVISEHSVKQWILQCDVITTWISTSIVEAFFAGKSCLIVRPLPIAKENEMPLYKDSNIIDSKEKFLNGVKADSEISVSEKVIRNYYDCNEIPSYIRLSNMLEKIHADDEQFFPWDSDKIKSFESKKWYYILQSALVSVYIPIINLMGIIREKTGVSWGKLNKRVESYRKAQTVKHTKLASDETIQNLTERIKKCM